MRLDRHAFGWNLRLAEFLALAPVSCVVAYAAWTGLGTAWHLDAWKGVNAFFGFVLVGLWVMALHYVVATIPSILTWGLAVRLCRALGLSADTAMRVAAPVTALMASLLLLVWLRDDDYRAMVPAICVVSVVTSLAVADRLVRKNPARGAA